MNKNQPQTPMPRYKCHKVVSALKIVGCPGSRCQLHFEPPFAPIEVSSEWVASHNPQAGGYYVVYEDGYTSFSPAEAFEAGYTRIQ